MNPYQVSIKITAQNLATTAIRQAAADIDKFAAQAVSSHRKIADGVGSISTQLERYKDLYIGFFQVLPRVAAGTREIFGLAETYKQLNARLLNATQGQIDYANAQGRTLGIALRTGQALEGIVGLYGKLRTNAGMAADDAERLTEIIAKVSQLDGGGPGAQAALFQLQQGLASGTLRGEELNSVLEQTPSLALAIAKGLGMTIGALRAYAEQGKLTAEEVKRALYDQQAVIEAQFANLPITAARAWQNVRTAAMQELGGLDKETGLTDGFAAIVQGAADNMRAVIATTVAGTAAIAGIWAQHYANRAALEQAAHINSLRLIAERTAAETAAARAKLAGLSGEALVDGRKELAALAVQSVAARTALEAAGKGTSIFSVALSGLGNVLRLLTGPIGLVATGVGAVTAALYANRDSVVDLGGTHATVSETLKAAWQTSTQAIGAGLDWIGDRLGLSSVRWGDLFMSVFDRGLAFARNFVNGVIGLFVGLGDFIGNTAGFIVAQFRASLGSVAGMVGGVLRDIKAALSGDFSFSGFKAALAQGLADTKANWDQYAASVKGSLDKALGTDYVGKAVGSVKLALAEQVAANRQLAADKQAEEWFNSTAQAATQYGNAVAGAGKQTQQAAKAAQAAAKEWEAYQAKYAQAQENSAKAAAREAEAIAGQVQRLREQTEEYGLSVEALHDLEQSRLDVAIAAAEQLEGERTLAGASNEEISAVWKKIDALTALKQARQDYYDKKTAVDLGKAATDAAKASEDDWKRAGQEIERSLTDALMRGFESGKDFGRNLVDTLKNMFSTLVLRPIIQPIAQGLSNVVLGAVGMGGAGAANAASGQLMGSPFTFNPMNFFGGNSIGMGFQGVGDSMLMAGLPTGNLTTAGMIPNWQFGVAGALGGFAGQAMFGGHGGIGGSIGSTIGFAVGGPVGAVIGTLIGGAAGGALGREGNEWASVTATPDAALSSRIKSTHGASALKKTDSGLELGASWKRADSEQAKAALTAMAGIDTALFSLTGADMTGKLGGTYGYNKKAGGYLANGKSVDDMDAVMAQFTRDWVAAADTVTALNQGLVASVTGSAAEVMAKTASILSMTADDMAKLFGEGITADKLKSVAKAGDGAGDAFARLAPIFASTGNLAKIMGADVATAFGAAGLSSSAARERLVKNAGGSEALNAGIGSYVDNYFTDREKLQLATQDVSDGFAKLGKTMPATKAEFRAMMEGMAKSGDLATESGSKLYAELLKLAPAFSAIKDNAKAATDAMRDQAASVAQAALERVSSAIEADKKKIDEAFDEASKSAEKSIDGISSSVDKLRGLSTALRDTIVAIRPPEYLANDRAAAQAQLQSTLAIAKAGGVLPTAESLSGMLDVLQKPAEQLYASRSDYLRDYATTAGALAELSSLTDGQLSTQEQALDVAKRQLETLKETRDKEISRLDAILAKAKDQVDAALGIKTAVDGLDGALRELGRAITGLDLANRPDVGASVVGNPKGQDALVDGAIVTTARNGGNMTDESISKAIGLGVARGYSPKQIADVWNAANPDQKTDDAAIVKWAQTHDIPKLAVGTNYVPRDMLALLHEGESVQPKAYNPAAGAPALYFAPQADYYRASAVSGADLELDKLLEAVDGLRDDLRAQNGSIATNTGKLAKLLDRVTPDGDALAVRMTT